MKSDHETIASSHRLLLSIFRHAEQTSLHCGDAPDCSADRCPARKECLHKARETFHRVLFATIGHFGREDRLIRHVIAPDAFVRHASGHAAIADAIQLAINEFGRDQDIPSAFRSIRAIGQLYAAHHAELDSEYLPLLAARNGKA